MGEAKVGESVAQVHLSKQRARQIVKTLPLDGGINHCTADVQELQLPRAYTMLTDVSMCQVQATTEWRTHRGVESSALRSYASIECLFISKINR